MHCRATCNCSHLRPELQSLPTGPFPALLRRSFIAWTPTLTFIRIL